MVVIYSYVGKWITVLDWGAHSFNKERHSPLSFSGLIPTCIRLYIFPCTECIVVFYASLALWNVQDLILCAMLLRKMVCTLLVNNTEMFWLLEVHWADVTTASKLQINWTQTEVLLKKGRLLVSALLLLIFLWPDTLFPEDAYWQNPAVCSQKRWRLYTPQICWEHLQKDLF